MRVYVFAFVIVAYCFMEFFFGLFVILWSSSGVLSSGSVVVCLANRLERKRVSRQIFHECHFANCFSRTFCTVTS
uniref:Putative secreted peptide n=1 Tax=Anopheles braziliensis TaxID=58242 RepID=A0A2M3ZVG1_9DIPT